MNNKYIEYRKKYKTFIYENYEVIELEDKYKIVFSFNIPNLTTFNPSIEIEKKDFPKHSQLSNYLIFNIGLIELISYWKCVCPEEVIIKCGYLNEEQISWFKKIYYYGLGEFFYLNNIEVSIDDFMHITCDYKNEELKQEDYFGTGCLIPIGGGKDSNVTLEILGSKNNDCFMLNPKDVSLKCSELAGFNNNQVIFKRTIDKNLITLNKEGYLNGHTPFSALLAFITFFAAYEHDKKYIALSNENSANEATVIGTKVNHQYSKSYEFENDFNYYAKKYFKVDIKYFSFLRPLSELQIAYIFSRYPKYHSVFKSCNVGSKKTQWQWCCNCGKCLFVYIILSPFLYKDDLVKIFGEDLYEKESLKEIFLELIGSSKTKPFDCVGTIKEVRYALSLTINKIDGPLPYLLKYYKENYELSLEEDLLSAYNNDNNLDEEYEVILKRALEEYDRKNN